MGRRCKLDLICSEADRDWVGERITKGLSSSMIAAALRRMGYGQIVARDVAKWRESTFAVRQNAGSAPTPEDRYCLVIEQLHEFCDASGRQFKAAMIEAITQWMQRAGG